MAAGYWAIGRDALSDAYALTLPVQVSAYLACHVLQCPLFPCSLIVCLLVWLVMSTQLLLSTA